MRNLHYEASHESREGIDGLFGESYCDRQWAKNVRELRIRWHEFLHA